MTSEKESSKSRFSKPTSERKWAPFNPYAGVGRPLDIDTVKLLRAGTIRLSIDIAQRLGNPKKVQLLTSDDDNLFAVQPAESPVGSVTLSQNNGRAEFRVNRLMASLHRDLGQMIWTLELRHWWEGELLIVDVSEVPTEDVNSSPELIGTPGLKGRECRARSAN